MGEAPNISCEYLSFVMHGSHESGELTVWKQCPGIFRFTIQDYVGLVWFTGV